MFNIDNCNDEMASSISAYTIELKNIRTGRVSPEILKSIIIDSYGSKMPLTQLSNINNIDNMTLSISIWDASLTKNIEKVILESNLGATPQAFPYALNGRYKPHKARRDKRRAVLN